MLYTGGREERIVKLSQQQQQVLGWLINGSGSANVVARAGCGKTTTLMVLVEEFVKRNMGEVQILAYNKSIATELQDRLKSKGIDWKRATAGTVHSVGFGAWRKVAPNVKVDGNKVANIIAEMARTSTDPDTRTICQEVPQVVDKLVSFAKQQGFGFLVNIRDEQKWWEMVDHFGGADDIDDAQMGNVVDIAIEVLEASIRLDNEVIDFDDMIIAPLIHKAKIWPKDLVALDEAQDTNPARRALAMALLRPRTGRMVAVGDPAQAIYGFTGANHDSMDLIKDQLGSVEFPLNKTYRCPKRVVKMANQWVPDIEAMPEAPEGSYRTIVEGDLFKEGLGHDDAILCRNTKPIVSLAYSLLRRSIPCYVEGREIGQGLVKLIKKFRTQDLDVLRTKLENYMEREMQKFLAKGKEAQAEAVEDRVGTILALIDSVEQEEDATTDTLLGFIDRLFGDTREGERPKCVVLSTVHKAKGREWKRVFILKRQDLMPSKWARKDWQIQQEFNLLYVAVTRAMEELIDII